jgi:hypothetical protein
MKLLRHLRDRRGDHFRRAVRARDIVRRALRAKKLGERVARPLRGAVYAAV